MNEKMKKLGLGLFTTMAAFTLIACGSDNGGSDTDDSGDDTTEPDNGGDDTSDGSRPETLTVGFIPSSDVENIQANADPIADYLSDALDMPVEVEVTQNYAGLVESMVNGNTHVGFLPAFGYVQATERGDVEVVAKAVRFGSPTYLAQYTTRADSGLETFEDLVETEGLTWAFPDFSSTSGYLFPGIEFVNAGVDMESHFNELPAGGHDGALIAVLDGEADFATTFDGAESNVEDEFPDVEDEIHVIGFTQEIPNDTISIYGGLSDDFKAELSDAILNMDDDTIAMIHEFYEWDDLVEANDEEFDIVRDAYAEFSEFID